MTPESSLVRVLHNYRFRIHISYFRPDETCFSRDTEDFQLHGASLKPFIEAYHRGPLFQYTAQGLTRQPEKVCPSNTKFFSFMLHWRVCPNNHLFATGGNMQQTHNLTRVCHFSSRRRLTSPWQMDGKWKQLRTEESPDSVPILSALLLPRTTPARNETSYLTFPWIHY